MSPSPAEMAGNNPAVPDFFPDATYSSVTQPSLALFTFLMYL